MKKMDSMDDNIIKHINENTERSEKVRQSLNKINETITDFLTRLVRSGKGDDLLNPIKIKFEFHSGLKTEINIHPERFVTTENYDFVKGGK